jgi:zinc protease
LAIGVGGGQTDGFDPGLAYFALTLAPDADIAAAEARLREELERIVSDGVSDAELAKARNLRLAEFWRGLQTINGKASALGNFEVFTGNYENLFAVPKQLSDATAAQLQAVAGKVFRDDNMTIGILRTPLEEAKE